MNDSNTTRTGGQVLIEELKRHGARLAFGVPGESFLAALDAFVDHPELSFITCRQEGGAAMMAEAYGKLTNEPGICFVTRGPGATSASAGVHVAFQDSTPMILFIGQVARDMLEREAFQEIDYRRMYGQLAKWVAQIDDPARIPEYVSRAFYTATSGRPGPVVLALPEDVLSALCLATPAHPYRRVETAVGPADMARFAELLSKAQRPLAILGGGGWTAATSAAVAAFAETQNLPITCSFRCQDYFDNRHPNYVGDVGIGINPKLAARVAESDLLIALGPRLGEMTTGGYTLLDVPTPLQPLVHIHPGAEELGRVYQPVLAINSSQHAFAEAAAELPAMKKRRWDDWTAAAREDYLAYIQPPTTPGELQMGEVMLWLREALPEDAIVTNGAGNYAVWVHRFFQYKRYGTQLAPTAGSMGYGLPAAVAAKAVNPKRTVICFAGDGCYLMHGQELATAVQYGLNIIVIVVNNNMLGTIRMHQERTYPGRISGTDLANPDFAAYAKAFGAHGETVRRTEDFPAAFERALAAGKPAILELVIDPEAITPRESLSAIREKALGRTT
jgi:acetolactate synthase-1/2/3 large subunit